MRVKCGYRVTSPFYESDSPFRIVSTQPYEMQTKTHDHDGCMNFKTIHSICKRVSEQCVRKADSRVLSVINRVKALKE